MRERKPVELPRRDAAASKLSASPANAFCNCSACESGSSAKNSTMLSPRESMSGNSNLSLNRNLLSPLFLTNGVSRRYAKFPLLSLICLTICAESQEVVACWVQVIGIIPIDECPKTSEPRLHRRNEVSQSVLEAIYPKPKIVSKDSAIIRTPSAGLWRKGPSSTVTKSS